METAFGVTIDLHPIDREFFTQAARVGRCRAITFDAFLSALALLIRAFMARGLPGAIVSFGVRLARRWREITGQVMA